MYHGHAFVNILPLFIQLIIFHDELFPFSEGCKSEWTGKIIRGKYMMLLKYNQDLNIYIII